MSTKEAYINVAHYFIYRVFAKERNALKSLLLRIEIN